MPHVAGVSLLFSLFLAVSSFAIVVYDSQDQTFHIDIRKVVCCRQKY